MALSLLLSQKPWNRGWWHPNRLSVILVSCLHFHITTTRSEHYRGLWAAQFLCSPQPSRHDGHIYTSATSPKEISPFLNIPRDPSDHSNRWRIMSCRVYRYMGSSQAEENQRAGLWCYTVYLLFFPYKRSKKAGRAVRATGTHCTYTRTVCDPGEADTFSCRSRLAPSSAIQAWPGWEGELVPFVWP